VDYGVVLFHTTSSAIRAEKVLKKEGCALKLIPTPRQFSSDCGIALRFSWDKRQQVKALLEESKMEIDSVRRF